MKNVLFMLMVSLGSLLQAQVYKSNAAFTAESKNSACSRALELAKIDAMQQAGTLVLSDFSSNKSDVQGKIQKSVKQKLRTLSLGIAKLQTKKEKIEVTKDYQFTCSLTAEFSIDSDEMKEQYKELVKEESKAALVDGYYEAQGYSENGQSRYKAFTAAKLVAQRNLLEEIKGAKITSLTKFDSGELEDKIAKLLSGSLQGAKIIKQEYNEASQSAYVILRISKEKIDSALGQ